MKQLIVFAGLWAVGITILGAWLVTNLHYRIGSAHLKVLLFGLTLRRIPLADIKRISKRRPSKMAEYWCSTFKTSHRILTIQRYSGLRKAVVISPRNRYVFLADLQNAIKRVKPESDLRELVEPGSDTSILEQEDNVRGDESRAAT